MSTEHAAAPAAQQPYTTAELMVAAGARALSDGQIVVVGLGIPLVAAGLAQRTHAPRLRMLNEIGVADFWPVELGVGNSDPRMWYHGASYSGHIDVMGSILHRGLVDVGFLGALEVDVYGNINSTEVPARGGGIRRFGGSGGAGDMASLARETIIILRHERQKLVERVRHITSAGYLDGPGARQRAGLRGGGPSRVITDKAVFGFDPATCRIKLLSIHPGVTPNDLRDNTGFALDIPADLPTTPPPTPDDLAVIHAIDPGGRFTKN
jgi:acyl CoA:acetate/3-ketoacid CoA transferase beta subunit